VLHGEPRGVPVYALSRERWIPADVYQTTPDGAFYAYAVAGEYGSGKTDIHVVDVAQATERVFTVPSPVPPLTGLPTGVVIEEFDGSDVYYSYPRMEAHPEGIWRLNVVTGTVRALSQASGVMAVHSGYAWFGRADPRDPSPPSFARGGEFFNSIWRLELATGSETLWYYAPGQVVVVRGFDDGGRPVIGPDPTLRTDPQTFRLIRMPHDVGTVIHSGPPLMVSDALTDVGSLWFSNHRGIYIWTPSAGLRKVFAFDSDRPNSPAMYLAGRCAAL
jgi:hypothetical protein